MSEVRPERVAAASRALQPVILERLALHADRIANGLARDLRIVPWERVHLIGLAQRRLQNLREQRFGHPGGPKVRVVERRAQPLESIDLCWKFLRMGRPVYVEFEAGASSEVQQFLREMAELVGPEVMGVGEPGAASPEDVREFECVGVVPARERIGLVQRDGDRGWRLAYLRAPGQWKREMLGRGYIWSTRERRDDQPDHAGTRV